MATEWGHWPRTWATMWAFRLVPLWERRLDLAWGYHASKLAKQLAQMKEMPWGMPMDRE